jgi:hypothetical protein
MFGGVGRAMLRCAPVSCVGAQRGSSWRARKSRAMLRPSSTRHTLHGAGSKVLIGGVVVWVEEAQESDIEAAIITRWYGMDAPAQ